MKTSIPSKVTIVRRLALGLVFSLSVAHQVAALPLTQNSPLLVFQDFVEVGTTLSAGQSLNGTFGIVSATPGSSTILAGYANAGQTFSDIGGYVPATSLTSAKAYFYVRDANQGNDIVGLSLGGTQFFNASTGSGNTHSILEGTADLSLLQTNGLLSYSIDQFGVSRGSGFTVDYVQLQVVTPSESSTVPEEGTTIALLGMGLVGLALLQRKTKA